MKSKLFQSNARSPCIHSIIKVYINWSLSRHWVDHLMRNVTLNVYKIVLITIFFSSNDFSPNFLQNTQNVHFLQNTQKMDRKVAWKTQSLLGCPNKSIKLRLIHIISLNFMDLCRVISLIFIEFHRIMHLGI